MYWRVSHRLNRSFARLIALSFALTWMVGADLVRAEPAPLHAHMETVLLDSGALDNPGNAPAVVFSETIDLGPEVPWVRVLFSDASLPEGSFVRVTSLLDGESQTLDAKALARWGNGTGFFNGSAVEVELIAGPHTTGSFVSLEELFVGEAAADEPGEGQRAICDPNDDREPSTDRRVGRLVAGTKPSPTGGLCTAFIIDTPAGTDKLHLTAGHCFRNYHPGGAYDGFCNLNVRPCRNDADCVVDTVDKGPCNPQNPSSPFDRGQYDQNELTRPYVLQFDVLCPVAGVPSPTCSTAGCVITHPPIANQFPVKISSVISRDEGIGNDHAVFQCERQGGVSTFTHSGERAFPMVAPPMVGPPAKDVNVRVTGHGADGNAPGAAAGGGGAAQAACKCTAADATGQWNLTLQTHHGLLVAGGDAKPTVLSHQVDTCAGNSGSPIIIDESQANTHTGSAIGIHTHAGCKPPVPEHNHGTAITTHAVLMANINKLKSKKIPTVSEWGLIVMIMLALTAGTIVFGRLRRPAAA